ncbi:hypothetical protein [Lewinella sp. IMCC34183]|uniref:hypothetical protein n=1 Tax=Lewinella sp. IMCC34183 TaxID=2248762 RepID=UPI000E2846FF|nr:hypothetical protein [Lewinella sp. IMCC34183]
MEENMRIVRTIPGPADAHLITFFHQGGTTDLVEANRAEFSLGGDSLLFVFTLRTHTLHLKITRSNLRHGGYGYIRLHTEFSAPEDEESDLTTQSAYGNNVVLGFASSPGQGDYANRVLDVFGIFHTFAEEEVQHAVVIAFDGGDVIVIEQNDAPEGFNVQFNPPNWMPMLVLNPL